MSERRPADALLQGLERLDVAQYLMVGWYDVVGAALAEGGYYLAPIVPVQQPQARASDPYTSKVAANGVRFTARSQSYLLLNSFEQAEVEGRDGLTDEEAMQRQLRVDPSSEYATRCSQLRKAGLIQDTGKDRAGSTGTPRIVSRITGMGRAELRRLSNG
jgi:hypothetical protein